jgi:hypothetical protein
MRMFVASLMFLQSSIFGTKITTTANCWMVWTACDEPSRIVCFVTELTRSAGIQLNKQVSLQGRAKAIA